jgi:DNA-binding MarR family transcriptional regulator
VARQSGAASASVEKTAQPMEPARAARPVKAVNGNAVPELDRLIHERVRLGIVSALAANESLTFNDLKKLLKTTDGNLSVHARKLEDAEYITCTKSFEGRMPKTEYRLTAHGRQELERYLDHMEALIQAMRGR